MSKIRDLLYDFILILEGLIAAKQLCEALGQNMCLPALVCVMILAYLLNILREWIDADSHINAFLDQIYEYCRNMMADSWLRR